MIELHFIFTHTHIWEHWFIFCTAIYCRKNAMANGVMKNVCLKFNFHHSVWFCSDIDHWVFREKLINAFFPDGAHHDALNWTPVWLEIFGQEVACDKIWLSGNSIIFFRKCKILINSVRFKSRRIKLFRF